MYSNEEQQQENVLESANLTQRKSNKSSAPPPFIDNRPETQAYGALQKMVDNSKHHEEPAQLQKMANDHADQQKSSMPTPNNTGLPDNLKSGIENLSGYSMDDVKVHYNSDKPAQLQAHAYAQGTDIHIGSGEEKHLPHEAWHVVQQKQGRVKPTVQMKGGVDVNDDTGLEREADVMGAKALKEDLAKGDLENENIQLKGNKSKTTQLYSNSDSAKRKNEKRKRYDKNIRKQRNNIPNNRGDKKKGNREERIREAIAVRKDRKNGLSGKERIGNRKKRKKKRNRKERISEEQRAEQRRINIAAQERFDERTDMMERFLRKENYNNWATKKHNNNVDKLSSLSDNDKIGKDKWDDDSISKVSKLVNKHNWDSKNKNKQLPSPIKPTEGFILDQLNNDKGNDSIGISDGSKIKMDPSHLVLGTDYFGWNDKVTPLITNYEEKDNNKAPSFMSGHLYNKKEEWSEKINEEFIRNFIKNSGDGAKVEVNHSKLKDVKSNENLRDAVKDKLHSQMDDRYYEHYKNGKDFKHGEYYGGTFSELNQLMMSGYGYKKGYNLPVKDKDKEYNNRVVTLNKREDTDTDDLRNSWSEDNIEARLGKRDGEQLNSPKEWRTDEENSAYIKGYKEGIKKRAESDKKYNGRKLKVEEFKKVYDKAYNDKKKSYNGRKRKGFKYNNGYKGKKRNNFMEEK